MTPQCSLYVIEQTLCLGNTIIILTLQRFCTSGSLDPSLTKGNICWPCVCVDFPPGTPVFARSLKPYWLIVYLVRGKLECKPHGGQGLIMSDDNLRGEMQNMLELL